MDAMILAAGLGTRLRPLTDDTPKALIEVGGVAMLERVARRLIDAGADRIVVNVHHHADAIEAFIARRDAFGVDVRLSVEADAPLETGGGLRKAAPLLRRDAPFFLHNVDVLTEIPLQALYAGHREAAQTDDRVLATLAVHVRDTRRYLLFDRNGLCGRVEMDDDGAEAAREEVHPPAGETRRRAFAGIHVIEPRLLDRLEERGTFSILDPYLRLAGTGAVIRGMDLTGHAWLEIGTPERLAEARAWAEARSTGGAPTSPRT